MYSIGTRNGEPDYGYDTGKGNYELQIKGKDGQTVPINNDIWIDELELSNTYQLILITTVSGPAGLKSKIFESNVLLYFPESPTVSYRKNLVGINVPNIDETSNIDKSVLVVSQSNNKQYITLLGISDSGEITRQIDLSSGALSGFIIDGGIW